MACESQQSSTSAGGPQGLKTSVRVWAKRLSKPVNPLGDLIDLDQTSNLSWDEAQFRTASPNTPVSICFSDTCSSPETATAVPARTPKSSISNQSDKTAVASPGPEARKAVLASKDVEALSKGRAVCGAKVPWPFRLWFCIPLILLMASGAGALIKLLLSGKIDGGWANPTIVKLAQATGRKHLFFTIPPILISMLFSALWSWTDMEVRRLQPLINLASRPVIPDRSLTLDYVSSNVFVACFETIKWGQDGLVTLATFLSILSLTLQPLTGTLLTVREVWWVAPETTVSSISRVGLNQAADFLDMTSFQAASSFASADVMYNIGSPPFVSGGYTVAEFELPKVVNGTVYANRSAVLNQVSCAVPDSLATIKEETTPPIWLNTARFGQCEYTWTVESNATYLYGLALRDFAGCGQDFGSIPVQYRPVLFWFFMYRPQPAASIVLCTPHATVQNVSVAIDSSTQTMDVMPLHSSPDDTTVADIGSFAYNGLFFEESQLDETALARLQSIQQQLPGAVFEAARNKDPLLLSTFVNHGFTALTQDVYTTYLSLVAKSVYFVDDDDEQTSVRVGTICSRLFLVRSAANLLWVVMISLAVGGAILHLWHVSARRGLALPPHLGTLSASIWLTAQTDLALTLAEKDAGPEKVAQALAGYRYFIDRSTGQILRLPDHKPLRGHWMGRWLAVLRRKTAGLLTRKAVAVQEPSGSP